MREQSISTFSSSVHEAVHQLGLDAATAEVVGALDREGVRSLLIKGPAITRWLYDDPSERPYLDIDLFVPPEDQDAAGRVLESLRFTYEDADLTPEERIELEAEGQVARHARAYVRSSPRVSVDLHKTFPGVGAGPAELWAALASDSRRLTVGGRATDVPDESGQAFIVALQAAKQGAADTRALSDLARALATAPAPVWKAAAGIAERVRAVPALSAGLRLLPEGVALAERLALPRKIDVETALYVSSAPLTAHGFQRLADEPGLRAKAVFLARELVPTRLFMRHRFPIANRGPVGMALAYLWRPFSLLGHAGGGFRAWRRVRRGRP